MSHPVPTPAPSALEIRVFWNEALLDVIELSPPRDFFVGDGSASPLPVDFTLPEVEGLTAARTALVVAHAGEVVLQVPPGGRGEKRLPGGSTDVLLDPVHLEEGETAEVRFGAVRFSLRLAGREVRCPRGIAATDDLRPAGYFALSLALGGAFLASVALSVPSIGLLDDEGVNREQQYLMMQYLDAAAEREAKPDPAPSDAPTGGVDAPKEPARGTAGKMGAPTATAKHRRASGTEPGAEVRPATSREEDLRLAQNFGMVGLLATGLAAATVAPFSDAGVGSAATAGMFFGEIGDSAGTGGLAPSGPGEGGGGDSDQIGLRSIGTCAGEECAEMLKRRGRPGMREHVAAAPSIRPFGQSVTSGSLPGEVIQRIVRQSFGRFRGCYEDGLRGNPSLSGRVTARFVIARDGSVATVQSGGTDLPDPKVVACVLRAYSGLSFPAPKDGIVSVTYPLMFSPAT